jgi:uncharacterized protein (TIGR03086 family)
MVGLTRAVGLLERAVHYGLGSVDGIKQSSLSRPTPCARWDLEAVLRHVNDSVAALRQGAENGCIDLEPSTERGGRAEDLVHEVQQGTRQLLEGWQRYILTEEARQEVGGEPIESGVVALVGAVEIAVHSWDIAEARGIHRPIPVRLALDMLRWAPLIVEEATRPALFDAPVRISRLASPSDRLVAFLGRSPRAWAAHAC